MLGFMALALALPSNGFALKVKDEKVILEKLDDYSACQQRDYSGNRCNEALKDWVAEHPKDAFQAGKLTRRHMNAWGAIYYFDIAFEHGEGDCEDKDVRLAVDSAMKLPGSYKEVINNMKKIALGKCFTQLREELVEAVDKGGYAKKNLCADLTQKKAYSKSCE
jgi:hypothetical protein